MKAALGILCLALAAAQENRVVRGWVEDPSGAPVPQARVELTNQAGEVQAKTQSGEKGEFELAGLPSGEYDLEVEAKGFDKYTRRISVGQKPDVPERIRLRVAAVAEEVDVVAAAPDASSPSENLNAVRLGHLLEDLPVKEGDLRALPSLFLDRGAVAAQGPEIVVDGQEGGNLDMPLSAIKRIHVNRNPYSPEFSRPGRGRLEVQTQDGSRRHFHRDLSVIVRNAVFDARNAFARERPPGRRAIVEGKFDGPLIRDKATFLIAGRYFDFEDNAVITAVTPAGRLMDTLRVPEDGWRFLGRVDYRLGPAHALRSYYKFKNKSSGNQGVGGFDLPERAFHIRSREHKAVLSTLSTFGANISNEFRFSAEREWEQASSLNDTPALVILETFRGGGAQVSTRDLEDSVHFQNIVAIVRGIHTFRLGADARLRFLNSFDASNFGGTYRFSSLADYLANRPFLYSVNRGEPRVDFRQHEFAWFAQDEIRLRETLSLSVGLRYEVHNNLKDYDNLAPRLSIAWRIGPATVVRAGAGVFYERLPRVLTKHSLLYDGLHTREMVVSNPQFPLPPGAALPLTTPSIMRATPDLRSPRLFQGSVSVERRLGRRRSLSAEYAMLRGLQRFRLRNVNAPLPGTGVRPDASFINIDQFESSGSSRSHSLRVMYQMEAFGKVELISQYTLSRAEDNTSGLFFLPADNYNFAGEWGRSDFDRRHQVDLLGTLRLPYRTKLGAIVSLASGIPFNITTGRDDNGDTTANDRPPGIGRNTGRGPGLANVDLRLSKKIRFASEGAPKPEVRIDAFNVFNRVNFRNFIGSLRSPFFGTANAALPARQIQLSLQIEF